jgi:hypothetical protein
MLVFVRDDGTAVTSVTNSNGAMTAIDSPLSIGGFGYYAYYYKNPTVSFTHTITINTGSASASGCGVCYADVNLVAFPAAHTAGTGGASSSITLAQGSWSVFFVADRSGTPPSANTNVTVLEQPGGGASMTLFDSNGAQAAGSFTQTANVIATPGYFQIEIPTGPILFDTKSDDTVLNNTARGGTGSAVRLRYRGAGDERKTARRAARCAGGAARGSLRHHQLSRRRWATGRC